MLTLAVSTHSLKKSRFWITKGNLQERINNLISNGKIVNKKTRNKDSYWRNLDFSDITAESAFDFLHDFIPSTPTVIHNDLLPSPTNHTEPTANVPTSDFNIVTEAPKSFRRFKRVAIEDLKIEIILETDKHVDIGFQNELTVFKNKCEKLITVSYENSEICDENREKEITRKDNIIDQLLNIFWKFQHKMLFIHRALY